MRVRFCRESWDLRVTDSSQFLCAAHGGSGSKEEKEGPDRGGWPSALCSCKTKLPAGRHSSGITQPHVKGQRNDLPNPKGTSL